MRVVHVSTTDVKGGAARAAHRLHQGFDETAVNSRMYVRKKLSALDAVLQFCPDKSLYGECKRVFRYARIQKDYFPRYVSRPWSTGDLVNDDRTRFCGEVVDQLPPADIYNLHWVAGFVDIPTFFERVDKPIIWTLHDMNPFTGGCHYSFGCSRFEESCGRCPKLDSVKENDPSRRSWKRKHNAFEQKIQRGQIHIVAPSKWLVEQAEKSSLLGNAPIHHVPYGLDDSRFRPRDVPKERRNLNIPKDRKVVLFVAYSSTDPRKGSNLLIDALKHANIKKLTLVSVGKNEPEVPQRLSHIHVGYVDDDKKMARLYSLADLFVIPSLQDNLPNTVLESLACGTPVVGFDEGGIPDMVRPGETGWLAEAARVDKLRSKIEEALKNDTERRRMSEKCRQTVMNEYRMDIQARRYKNIYSSATE